MVEYEDEHLRARVLSTVAAQSPQEPELQAVCLETALTFPATDRSSIELVLSDSINASGTGPSVYVGSAADVELRCLRATTGAVRRRREGVHGGREPRAPCTAAMVWGRPLRFGVGSEWGLPIQAVSMLASIASELPDERKCADSMPSVAHCDRG